MITMDEINQHSLNLRLYESMNRYVQPVVESIEMYSLPSDSEYNPCQDAIVMAPIMDLDLDVANDPSHAFSVDWDHWQYNNESLDGTLPEPDINLWGEDVEFWNSYIGKATPVEKSKDEFIPKRSRTLVHAPDCPVCSLSSDRYYFTPNGNPTVTESRDFLGVEPIRWSDLVINPVKAGFNFKYSKFAWFGQDLASSSTSKGAPCSRATPYNTTVVTVSVVLEHLRAIAESVLGSESEPFQLDGFTNAVARLQNGVKSTIKVPAYLVAESLAVAVTTPTRQSKGRSVVRRFYNPRTDLIKRNSSAMSVNRQTRLPPICLYHLERYLNTPRGGITGCVVGTQIPIPNVKIDVRHYGTLLDMTRERLSEGKTTLIVLEGHVDSI